MLFSIFFVLSQTHTPENKNIKELSPSTPIKDAVSIVNGCIITNQEET